MDETDRGSGASWKPRPAGQEEKGGFGLSLQLLTQLGEAPADLVERGIGQSTELPVSPWGRGLDHPVWHGGRGGGGAAPMPV